MQACFQGLWLSNVGRVSWGGVENCEWYIRWFGQYCGCGFRGQGPVQVGLKGAELRDVDGVLRAGA